MTFTPAEQVLLASTRAFARDTVAPQAALWARERRIGTEALDEAVAIGLTRLQVPLAWCSRT